MWNVTLEFVWTTGFCSFLCRRCVWTWTKLLTEQILFLPHSCVLHYIIEGDSYPRSCYFLWFMLLSAFLVPTDLVGQERVTNPQERLLGRLLNLRSGVRERAWSQARGYLDYGNEIDFWRENFDHVVSLRIRRLRRERKRLRWRWIVYVNVYSNRGWMIWTEF